ncbi:MAG: SPOR domain-containing protein [Bacteroidota bacterium]
MAKDDQNKEEDEDFFGNDEDFGLPELDYDSLDDDDSEDEFAFDDLSDDDLKDVDDVFGDDDSGVEEKSEESIKEESASSDHSSSEESDDFFGEESFDEFETSEDDSSIDDILDDDLSDLDLEGDEMDSEDDLLGAEVGDDFSSDEYVESSNKEDSSKGNFARTVIIGIVIFAVLGGLFWWLAPMVTADDTDEEIAQITESEKPDQTKKPVESVETDNSANTTDENEAEQQANNSPTSPPPKTVSSKRNTAVDTTPGEINRLTARSNNYYIVIASFLDEDLAMDYSQKLAAEEKSPTVIPSFGRAITTRVAIMGYSSLSQAQNEIGNYKGEYGKDIWILKY